MSGFSLVPYTIRLRDHINDKDVLPGDKSNWGEDLLKILDDYLENSIPTLPVDPSDREKKIIRRQSHTLKARTISGILTAGGYGYEASLVDVEEDTVSYTRQMNDAELVPYYFLIRLPTTTPTGIAIFQKFRNLGAKDLFFKDFNEFLRNRFGGQFSLEMDALIPTDLVKRYLDNRIVKVRLIKYGYPREISDVNLDAIPEEEIGESEFILKAKKRGSLPEQILNPLRSGVETFLGSSDSAVGSILAINNFQADNVKVEVRIGKSYRTINLSNVDRLKFSEDITEKVKIDLNSGHPEFDSIDELANTFLKDCSEAIWGGELNV
jgi:hypothetical protein